MTHLDRGQLLIRAGFYAAVADAEFGDRSYYLKISGRADVTSNEDLYAVIAEVHARMVAAGKAAVDEDLFEKEFYA